ncbi:MAG: fasciclin domain-containing protein, partial [Chitinophagaceae bacterium]
LSCFLLLLTLLSGCKDKWDEHNEINDPKLKSNLFEKIQSNPDLSRFAELLKKTGYDTVLSSSLNYTVWAPNNAAINAVDEAILNNSTALISLVENHIVLNEYYTSKANPAVQLRALNGKKLLFSTSSVDEINLTSANDYGVNGVLHIIPQAIIPKQNIFEYLLSAPNVSEQKNHILTKNRKVFDATNAEIIGVDQKTGKPIYKPGTDSAVVNDYLITNRINDENRLYTYVVLSDAAFLDEEARLKGYFETSTTDSTGFLTRDNIIKDLAFDGLYTPGNLPDSLTSTDRDSVKIHIDPSAIVSSKRLSNGIVYVVNKINYNLSSKLGIIKLNENDWIDSNPVIANADRGGFLINRREPNSNTVFTQLSRFNINVAKAWFRFNTILKKANYKVYIRAARDVDSTALNAPTPFPQRIAFQKFDSEALPYTTVDVKMVQNGSQKRYYPNYDEIYVGTYTSTIYGRENVFIVSNAVTTIGLNNILADYIKLVPVGN